MRNVIQLSLVIPVYNAEATIASVVERAHSDLAGIVFEVILIDDGSKDASEQICTSLIDRFPGTVRFVKLSRNFGEHNAVIAGLSQSRGEHVGIIDDDGQHSAEQMLRLLEHQQRTGADVVYGNYIRKRHSWWRNVGSRVHGCIATQLHGKPSHIYLSSFKVLSRFLVDEVVKSAGPFPCIDGQILRITDRIEQIPVEHQSRLAGRSGYTLRKLLSLFLNMVVGFSLAPLRLAFFLGAISIIGAVLLAVRPLLTASVISSESAAWIQAAEFGLNGCGLIMLALLGEYVGRTRLHLSGQPCFVIRYVLERSQARG